MKEFKSQEKEGELHEQNACGDVDERGIPIKVKRIQLFSWATLRTVSIWIIFRRKKLK